MRIFLALPKASEVQRGAFGRTWYKNFYETLRDMGHKVYFFDQDTLIGNKRFRNQSERLSFASALLVDTFQEEHRAKPFDLFFSYYKDDMVDPQAVEQIRKSGVPAANFSCNNAHQFYLVEELSPHFDYNLHSEKDARAKFLAIGANPLWWPMASNPKYFKPQDVPRTIAVSFVGANYALRARYIAHLLENSVDVYTYGPGWQWGTTSRWRSVAKRYKFLLQALCAVSPLAQYRASAMLADHDFRRSLGARFPDNVHAPVSDDELIALYSRSQISLGFLEVYDRHDPSKTVTRHLHLREFEAPMSGALYCTGYMDELAEFFEPGKEVLVYRNQHELLDKVCYYLAHPDEAEKIRQAGRARALRDHTYHRRFETLFREIELGDR